MSKLHVCGAHNVHCDTLEYVGVFGVVVRRQASPGCLIWYDMMSYDHICGKWLEECCSKRSCLSYCLMADPAKDASNWTEHTHSDGRRYYYNKVGSPTFTKDTPGYKAIIHVLFCIPHASKWQVDAGGRRHPDVNGKLLFPECVAKGSRL